MAERKIGMVLFDGFTAQDFIGPYEVFSRVPGWKIAIIAKMKGLIEAEGGLKIAATDSISEDPEMDILFLPGGRGINDLLKDSSFLEFIRGKGIRAEYVTSVCTGSLVLAAAGLLDGFRATSHWRSLPLLKLFGVDVSADRVVADRNRVTGGGVTAGIDFALYLVCLLEGEILARQIELGLEYNPAPPLRCGHPDIADRQTIEREISRTSGIYKERERIIRGLISRGK